jgi:hypothetical protein
MVLDGGQRAEAVLRWADELASHAEPRHQLFSNAGQPSISVATYLDVPSPGWTFGLTYGASLVWSSGVEFVTIVQSPSPLWTWAIADFVDRHRSQTTGAGAGDTIDWHEPIAPDSAMDAFVIVQPRSLEPGSEMIHLTEDDHVQLLQVVPVHAVELPYVRAVGADRLLNELGETALDPRRAPLIE